MKNVPTIEALKSRGIQPLCKAKSHQLGDLRVGDDVIVRWKQGAFWYLGNVTTIWNCGEKDENAYRILYRDGTAEWKVPRSMIRTIDIGSHKQDDFAYIFKSFSASKFYFEMKRLAGVKSDAIFMTKQEAAIALDEELADRGIAVENRPNVALILQSAECKVAADVLSESNGVGTIFTNISYRKESKTYQREETN